MIAIIRGSAELAQKGSNEFSRDDGSQIVRAFAYSEKTERQGLPGSRERDRAHDPALRSPVELGEDQSGQAERLVEDLHLAERVLAGVRIEHQPYLVRRSRFGLGDGALDLGNLL